MEVRKTFKYRLRGGKTGELLVSDSEEKRLFKLVQNLAHDRDAPTPFIVFDSTESRILLNLKHLLYCHFLFDAGTWEDKKEDREEEKLTVIFADGAELSFGVDGDDFDPNKEDMGQFASMLFRAETTVEKDELFDFIDEDGEQVFLRAVDTAMIKIPLWVFKDEEIEHEGE
jgi:hypothetical protein